MLEQKICRVEFENGADFIYPRFGPLGNNSHYKQLHRDIEDRANREYSEILSAGAASDMEYTPKDRLYDEIFPTLQMMNAKGWKLESFAIVWDSNDLKMQVAIFSRNNPTEAELFIS